MSDDPNNFNIRPGCVFVAEMPLPVASLENIDGEIVAVLVGGATVPLGGFIDPDAQRHMKH